MGNKMETMLCIV